MSDSSSDSSSDSLSENYCEICCEELCGDTERCDGCYDIFHYDCINKVAYLGDGRDRDVLFYKCCDCEIEIVCKKDEGKF